MATHSDILAWKVPWTEEAGGYSPWDHKDLNATKHAGIRIAYQGVSITEVMWYMLEKEWASGYSRFLFTSCLT